MHSNRRAVAHLTAASLAALGIMLAGSDALAAGTVGQIGAALVYSSASGNLGKEDGTELSMSDYGLVKSAGVLRIDASYRLHPNFAMGVLGGIGIGSAGKEWKDACDQADISCTPFLFDIGGHATFHALPASSFDPWIGLVAGWQMAMISVSEKESNSSSTSDSSSLGSLSTSAFYYGVHAGADVVITKEVAAGPYIMFTTGKYGAVKAKNNETDKEETVFEGGNASHTWLSFGVRGVWSM